MCSPQNWNILIWSKSNVSPECNVRFTSVESTSVWVSDTFMLSDCCGYENNPFSSLWYPLNLHPQPEWIPMPYLQEILSVKCPSTPPSTPRNPFQYPQTWGQILPRMDTRWWQQVPVLYVERTSYRPMLSTYVSIILHKFVLFCY